MRFAWDERKASSNFSKHSISFEEAAVFVDPLSTAFPDQDHSIEEQRFVIMGYRSKVESW
jgi:uncharacterized DUF497 family protein